MHLLRLLDPFLRFLLSPLFGFDPELDFFALSHDFLMELLHTSELVLILNDVQKFTVVSNQFFCWLPRGFFSAVLRVLGHHRIFNFHYFLHGWHFLVENYLSKFRILNANIDNFQDIMHEFNLSLIRLLTDRLHSQAKEIWFDNLVELQLLFLWWCLTFFFILRWFET